MSAPPARPDRVGGLLVEREGPHCSPVRWTIPGLTVAAAWQAARAAFTDEAAHPSRQQAKLLLAGAPETSPARWPHHGAAAETGPWHWLATLGRSAADGGCLAYARDVQRHHRPIFHALVGALAPRLAALGMPGGPVEAEVFLGDYPSTPGGIHRERCANVHLVLAGAKSMHLWPDPLRPPGTTPVRADTAPGAGTPEEYLPGLDPASARADATTLTAHAGGGFTWPAGTWHVGETHGPALALNLAAYERTGKAGSLRLWGEHLHGEVPAPWLAAYRHHTGGHGGPADLLARLSALGMCPAPARPPAARLRSAGPLTCRSAAPVLWTPVGGGHLLVAALGAVATAHDGPDVRDWLARATCPGPAAHTVPASCRALAAWLRRQEILDSPEEA
ncbi:hypothetical protein QFZ75_008078 [Streptomyces sp. V3I8]|uniref:hypothetical protein n=1 Tax=Streptomyces sp. V3I8 TaxID=3042279 RepID=UPI002780978F|nr:hypothetical protein [Streptomyces sp. V3I8]MDQ1041576.1 hypothetical protein [Streptomyces sp. V3I8]